MSVEGLGSSLWLEVERSDMIFGGLFKQSYIRYLGKFM
jgi:hypothetical protein